MKKYRNFIKEEVTIKGNIGVPGEGGIKSGEERYLAELEKSARKKLQIGNLQQPPKELLDKFSRLIQKSKMFIRGNETKLEKLAEEIIRSEFGDILGDTKLDIKLVRSGAEVAKVFDCESCETPKPVKLEKIKDPELIKRIHKAKLGNVIIQGEGKNTKRMMYLDAVKDGLDNIYGNKSDDALNTWREITDIADKLDWLIPLDIKSDMLKFQPEGMAGAVKVDWEDPVASTEFEENLDDEWSISKPDTDFTEQYATPVIIVRAIDFPMLFHETVKGIYQLISSISMPMTNDPEELEKQQIVKFNVSSFEDEAEDFRTGPQIAGDFRDFINKNPKTNNYPNIRAYIFGKMMDPAYMTNNEFLKLFRGILNRSNEARIKVDQMIDQIINQIEGYTFNDEDWNTNNISYSSMSVSELNDEIDKAMDNEDWELVKTIQKYLN